MPIRVSGHNARSHGRICLQAGRPESVELRTTRTCSSGPPRKSSIPARQETRTLLGAGAGISRIRFPVDPIRTVPSKSDAPHRQPLAPLEVLAKLASVKDRPRSARLLEEEFGADPGVATTGAECTEVLNGGGSGGGLQRLGDHAPRTRHECPGAITAAREESAEGLDDSSLGVLELAATSASPFGALPGFLNGSRDGCRTFRRGRNQHAMLCQIQRDTRVRR